MIRKEAHCVTISKSETNLTSVKTDLIGNPLKNRTLWMARFSTSRLTSSRAVPRLKYYSPISVSACKVVSRSSDLHADPRHGRTRLQLSLQPNPPPPPPPSARESNSYLASSKVRMWLITSLTQDFTREKERMRQT